MKINWKIRFKNPQFWVQIGLAIIMPVFTYFNLASSDITTWNQVLDTCKMALSNPYVVGTVLISVYNSIIDNTVVGISDSYATINKSKPSPNIKTK